MTPTKNRKNYSLGAIAFLLAILTVTSYVRADSPPAPKPLTTDEAVQLSSFIIVGKAVRTFVKKNGVEIPDKQDVPLAVGLGLEVKVNKVLLNKEQGLSDTIVIDYVVDGSSVERLRERYLGSDLFCASDSNETEFKRQGGY
jgi:hypothetical protein